MCGYFGSLHECPAVVDLLNQLRIPLPYPIVRGYQRRFVDGLITATTVAGYRMSSAMWWYALQFDQGRWVPNERITSFNARNLHVPLWREAVAYRRGLVFATEIGESNGKDRYLMRNDGGMALGAVYRDWMSPSGEVVRSMAIITRPPHPRFSRYHAKSIPCFLPLDIDVLKQWLDPQLLASSDIQRILRESALPYNLRVTKVKSYKAAQPLAEQEWLESD